MKYSNKFLMLVGAPVVVLTMAGSALGDHFIRQASHVDAVEIMGQKQEAVNDTVSIWLRDDKSSMRSQDGKTYIFTMEDMMLYVVDHSSKKYGVMKSDPSVLLEQATEGLDEESKTEVETAKAAMIKQMVASMTVTVTPFDETKTVRDWNTKKYVVDMTMPMGRTTTEMWVTDQIDFNYEAYKSVANSQMATMPGYQKILAELQKIKGIPVLSLTETQVMSNAVKSTVEILEIIEKDAPDGTFDIPSGYKQVEITEM